MAGRAQKTGLVFGAIVLALLSSEAMADSAVLAHGEHAHVSGDVQARAIAPRVAGLIDESVPRIARLVGTDNLAPVPAVVYVDRSRFLAAIGAERASPVVGLATFPPGIIHIDGTGRLASIEKVVPHEVAHVMIGRAVGRRISAMPLWLNEGVAEYAAGERASQVDPVTLQAVGRGEWMPLSDLDHALRAGGRPQALAYAEAASVVNFLVSSRGPEVIAALLGAVREEGDFASAVKQVTGWSSEDLQSAWRRSVAQRWRWPLLLQSPILPFGLMLIIFVAGYIRYRRERRRRREAVEDDW